MLAHHDQDLLETKEYRFYPLTEAILIGLFFFCAIFLATYFIYHHAIEAQKQEIREGLVRTGEVLTRFVDADLHQTFTEQSQKSSNEYRQAIEPLRKAMDADDTIPFVYTTVMQDGSVYFVLDAIPPDDPDAVEIMEEYSDPSDELIAAFESEQVTTSDRVYSDEWGSYISAHIPIQDSVKSVVGVLSIDIDAAAYAKRLKPIERATKRAMVTGFFICYLIAALVWFMRNFALVIHQKRLLLVRRLREVQTPPHNK